MKILVTGCAGFIASHVVRRLCSAGVSVIGIDNMNDYYDVRLKEWRLNELRKYKNFSFHRIDIEDHNELKNLFSSGYFSAVVNLAARAGVRYSVENPHVYLTTNIYGTLNLLELCREYNVNKFVLASTSSIYAGKEPPFREEMNTSMPISPYSASKSAAEQLAFTYHYLYGIDVSILRYFTVYGPAGRPDMSILRFIKWINEGKEVVLTGDGRQKRDFTYVDDIVNGTIKAVNCRFGYEVFNLGGNDPHSMNEIIGLISNYLGKEPKITMVPFPKEDIINTCADIEKAVKMLEWKPEVGIKEGIKRTIAWSMENIDLLNAINV